MSELETTSADAEASNHDVVIADGKALDLSSKPDATKETKPEDTEQDKPDETTEAKAPEDAKAKDDEAGEDPDEDKQSKPPKQNRFKNRIDGLTRDKHEALRRAEYAEQRAAALEKRLQEQPDIPADDYDAQERHRISDALNQSKAEDARLEADQARQQAVVARNTTFFAKAEATLGDKAQEFVEKFAQIPMSHEACDILVDSEVGVEMGMYLASNPADAVRLAQLNPVQQARELTRLEAKIQSAPKVKRQTSAPPPPKTVEAAASPVGQKSPTEMSDAEYSAWYRKRNNMD